MVKNLNKIAKEIYEANRSKGFHDEEHSYEHMMCLVISELMEAVEADRKGRKTSYHPEENFGAHAIMEDEKFKEWFECTTKDTVEDELADAVIRLFDTAGALGLELKSESINELVKAFNEEKASTMKFTECIYVIVFAIVDTPYDHSSTTRSIRDGLALIIGYCSALNIDLWKHVELKLKYNSLRPYKHGKAY